MTSKRASDVAGDRIKERRQQQGLTAVDLAARCGDLGAPEITAAVIANIETGRRDKATGKRRRDVTVDELLVLARALHTSPADLLTPPDRDIAITSELVLDPYRFTQWFTGYRWGPLPPPEFDDNVRVVRLYHRARECVNAYQAARNHMDWVERTGEEMTPGSAERRLEAHFGHLAIVVDQLIDAGLEPPRLSTATINRLIAEERTRFPERLMKARTTEALPTESTDGTAETEG